MTTKFHKEIKTKKSKEELRNVVTQIMNNLPDLSLVLNKFEWQGDNLVFDSKLGDGYFQILDYLVIIDINLNFAGSLAKNRLETVLDEEFLKLDK